MKDGTWTDSYFYFGVSSLFLDLWVLAAVVLPTSLALIEQCGNTVEYSGNTGEGGGRINVRVSSVTVSGSCGCCRDQHR